MNWFKLDFNGNFFMPTVMKHSFRFCNREVSNQLNNFTLLKEDSIMESGRLTNFFLYWLNILYVNMLYLNLL